MHLLFFAQRELRIRPADRSRGINMIAGFKLSHIRANLFDHTRAVVPRRVRQLWQSRVCSRANVSLHRVNTHRLYLHEHLTQPGLRRRHLFQPQDFRTSERIYPNCFQALFSFLFHLLSASTRMEPLGRDRHRWANRKVDWSFWKSDIEGKAAREAASELGKERVSNEREQVSQSPSPLCSYLRSIKHQIDDKPGILLSGES